MKPGPGDFGLVAITGRVGTLIRVLQWLNGDGWSGYQHAFVVLDDGTLLEAEPGGARVMPLSEYDGTDVTFSSWTLTDVQRADIVRIARSLVGTPYSALDYAALALHRFRIPAPWLRRYIASRGHLICSQLVDLVYHDAGVELFTDGRWPGFITPGDLIPVLTGPVAGKDRR